MTLSQLPRQPRPGSNLFQWSGLLAALGSILWTATWILVALTGGGTRDVAGFSERGWRTLLLNPAILLFMAGLIGFHLKQAARSGRLAKGGFALCLLSLGAMLIGNVVEFWVSEPLWGSQAIGWGIMGVGLLLLPISLLLFGIGTLRASVFSGWRGAVPFGFGMFLTLLILSGVTRIVVSGSWSQVEYFRAVVLTIALGWGLLGLALWSDQGTVNLRSTA